MQKRIKNMIKSIRITIKHREFILCIYTNTAIFIITSDSFLWKSHDGRIRLKNINNNIKIEQIKSKIVTHI